MQSGKIHSNSIIMKFLIIEDHPLIRVGMTMMIFDFNSRASVKEASTFPEGLALLDTQIFDYVILDIDVPGSEGTRMIKQITDKQERISVLIHSGYDEHVYALSYLSAGASGFISKQSSKEDFKAALRALVTKKKYISAHVQQSLLNNMINNNPQTNDHPFVKLSNRELEVMRLINEGKWTKEIASILDIKVSTVSTYRARIYDKLDVKNEIELSRKISLFNYH